MTTRNKMTALALTLLVCLGAASAASAGGSIFAGADFPTGGFDDVSKTGFTGGLIYTVPSIPIVDIGGFLAYNNFSVSLGDDTAAEDFFKDSVNAWELHLLGQLSFGGLKGFLGLGLANHNAGTDSRTNDFSWQMGLAMAITKVEFRLGYHQIPLDESSLNWMALTIGLNF